MPKPVKAAPTKKVPVDPQFSQAVLIGLVVLVAILYGGFRLVTAEEPAVLVDYATQAGIAMPKMKVARAADGGLRVVATAIVRRGDVIMSAPVASLISAQGLMNSSKYGKALSHDKAQHIKNALMAESADASFINVFLYTFYLALERRDPLSPLQAMFKELAPFSEADGALHWPAAVTECLDQQASGSIGVMWRGLEGSVAAGKAVCAVDATLCGSAGPPSLDELRYAMTVYMKFNFQDQALIPMMMFARFNNSHRGLTVSFNAERQELDVISDADAKKGEELYLNFPRGPAMQMVSRGIFDPASYGIDVMVDIKSVANTRLGKRYCVDKYHELMFGVDGKPRDAVLSCVALLMSTAEQRQTFSQHRTFTELMKGVYASLKENLSQMITDFEAETAPSCVVSPYLRSVFDDYERFMLDVLRKNFATLTAMEARLSG